MYLALLGRQPELSLAELERRFTHVDTFSPQTALVDTPESIDIQSLGGTQKIGRVVLTLPRKDWRATSMKLVAHYQKSWSTREGKLTLGLSAYDFPDATARDLQKTGLVLKQRLKKAGPSLRLIPNKEAELSTATSHHNKLGLSDNKIELMIVRGRDQIIIAESLGTQNITALAARDQGRPRRDAFVGMLPPKLALMMLNLAGPLQADARILDPFCGTGVVLQESLLRGFHAYGTDLADKMVSYSSDNLAWLADTYRTPGTWTVTQGDATDTTWQSPVSAVVAETYLGQPFSAPPSPAKLTEVRGNCQHIISQFLKNLHSQLPAGTPVVLAVPAWRDATGQLTHLPLTKNIETYGFQRIALESVDTTRLAYFRPDQVVAREILILQTH